MKELVKKHCYNNEQVLEIELAGYQILGAILARAVPAALLLAGSGSKTLFDRESLCVAFQATRLRVPAVIRKRQNYSHACIFWKTCAWRALPTTRSSS